MTHINLNQVEVLSTVESKNGMKEKVFSKVGIGAMIATAVLLLTVGVVIYKKKSSVKESTGS